MKVKIIFTSKTTFTREEYNAHGKLSTRKTYNIVELPDMMKTLSGANHDGNELLNTLRVSYRLFKPNSMQFVKPD